MTALKLGVLISGRGSNLQALIAACADAGFPADAIDVGYLDQLGGGFRWFAAIARKPETVSAAA